MGATLQARMIYDCDLCGCADAIEVPFAREYTGDQPIHICTGCGFVHIKERRSAQEIAASWSTLYDGTYNARSPAVLARLTYVAETINQEIGFRDKIVCDIGAGGGAFLSMAQEMGAEVFGIEPSIARLQMIERDIRFFAGAAEECTLGPSFDIVTINWSLENCADCVAMLQAARRLLKPSGRLVVATGSRILVPFKKPLRCYLGRNAADTHAFRFSANTLRAALGKAGFSVSYLNSHVDSDVLLVIGEQSSWQIFPRDDVSAVAAFFVHWHQQWP